MQSRGKSPTSEVVESSRERPVTRESVVPRRDDRAEPDDDPGSSISRVDVVTVDGGGRETPANAMVTLRRELAKLHQQAAAVEKSFEDQRKDRSESAERIERLTERNAQLEAKLANAETEASTLRRTHEHAMDELQNMRAERDDLARAVEAAKEATSDLARLREEGEKHKRAASDRDAELSTARAKLDRLSADAQQSKADATQAHDDTARARQEASEAQAEIAKVRDEAKKARDDAARAKEDNARDRATARDKIDLLERALDEAREAAVRNEQALDAARAERDLLAGRLETAQKSLVQATAAHDAFAEGVRALRDEVAAAFSRVSGAAAASGDAPSSGGIISIPPEAIKSVPPAPAPAVSAPPPLPRAASTPAPSIDNEWTAPASAPPPTTSEASPASKSVPPPRSASPPPLPASIPPPTYASVPPQIHGSARALSAPPAPLEIQTPAIHAGFAPPGAAPEPDYPGPTREELLAKLVDPDAAEAAAAALRERPKWLRSVPPPALTAALAAVDYDAEGPVFELARAWDREPLCHALIAALRGEQEPRLREHGAWLLKHLAAPSAWKAIAELARSEEEPLQLRRWLLEALDRLAAGRAIGWRELGDLVTAVAKHADPTLRDGVVGILVSLDRSDEKRRLLLDILRDDDDEVVIASAVNALASVLPIELDPAVVERLLGHPSARVQRSLRDLIERARREAKA
ncbi:MAG: hypothetical protein KF819_08970 [Labilithrix sp.]|nr:hypothetical protein [Labilithrix sp.]